MCIVARIVYIKAISNDSEYSPWTPQNIQNRQMFFVGGNIIVHIYTLKKKNKKKKKKGGGGGAEMTCVLPWQCKHCS